MEQLPACFGDNKRYHNLSTHWYRVFEKKMGKLSLDGGFTCPNRDGAKGHGGCIYCSGKGGGEFTAGTDALEAQFRSQKGTVLQKWPQAAFIAYFQAFTNTYAPIPVLREKFEYALAQPGVEGLAVATRADALPEEVLDYLEELSRKTYLIVELGLQSIHEGTGRRINRCHTYGEFLQGFWKLKRRGIQICIHLINGLPGETGEMMRQTAQEAGRLSPHSIKLHMLYIQKGAAIEELWRQGKVPLMEREAYISLVCDQLERIPSSVVMQRLTGDPDKSRLLAPYWVTGKRAVLNGIDKELRRRNTWQGRLADSSADASKRDC